MEATEVSVCGFFYKLVCSGSQQIHEQMITRTRMRRKRATFLISGTIAATSVRRCVWTQSRSQDWWDRDVNGFTETDFIQNFRMSRATFNYIFQRLSTRLSKQDTQFRRPISLRKRAGVGLYWLATGVERYKSRMHSNMTVQTELDCWVFNYSSRAVLSTLMFAFTNYINEEKRMNSVTVWVYC